MRIDGLDDLILKILFDWQNKLQGKPKMPVKTLYDELYQSYAGRSMELFERKANQALYSLEEKNFIKITATNSFKNGFVQLTEDGVETCEAYSTDETPEFVNSGNENSSEIPKASQLPDSQILSLLKLASDDLEFSSRFELRRLDEVYRLKSVFYDNLSHNHVAVYFGLSLLGKSTIARNFQSVAKEHFAPIMIDLKSCEMDKSLDDFLLSFHDLISSELTDMYKDPMEFPAPVPSQYRSGKGKNLFLEFWLGLSKYIPDWRPILIIDEIGTLSDNSLENDDVLNFMIEFISNPENGYFLLVGRETITRSGIDRFRKLIEMGPHLEASSLPFGINQKILDLIRKRPIKIEADLDKQILYLCDGHPYIIMQFFDALLIKVSKTQPLEIRLEDFDMTINSTIEECDPSFSSLFQDLSEEEQKIIKEWGLNYKNGESIFGLTGTTYNTSNISENEFQRGIAKLKNRGWVEETEENKFLFKFMFLLIWYRKQHYTRTSNEK